MRFTVNDASQCAVAGAGTRPSNFIFDSVSQTPPLRMHSAIRWRVLDLLGKSDAPAVKREAEEDWGKKK